MHTNRAYAQKTMTEETHDLLATVAAMYYLDEMTQNAIADELGLSRVKVYRLLKQARDEDVVQIFVNWPQRRDGDLEAQLAAAFDLGEALVLQATPSAHISSPEWLGQMGARFLEERLTEGATLAVCLGRATYEAIQAIRPNFRVHVNVAQALGSMPATLGELDSAALARQLALKLGGDVHYLPAPFMAESAADAAVLRRQRTVDATLRKARAADIALLGIGTVTPTRSSFVRAGYVTADALETYAAAGVVGDMAGRLFDMDGTERPQEINERVIGLTLDDLRDIPLAMAIAMGEEKVDAILGALRTGVLNVLVTDDRTARLVLTRERVAAVV